MSLTRVIIGAMAADGTSSSPIWPCLRCRGWSCLDCADAVDHGECRMNCPDCDDLRMYPEERWLLPTAEPAMVAGGLPVRQARRANTGMAYRIGGRQDYPVR